MLNGTTSAIDNGVSKASDAIGDATDTVKDFASEKSSALEGVVRTVKRVLPALPSRVFLSLLDRVGLARKPARTDGLGAFALGFVAGGTAALLFTPVSGPTMRKNIARAFKQLGSGAEEAAAAVRERASEAVHGAGEPMDEVADPPSPATRAVSETAGEAIDDVNEELLAAARKLNGPRLS